MNLKTKLLVGLTILITAFIPGAVRAIDPGEGVLRIEKRLVVPATVRGSVDEFSFQLIDPAGGDAAVATGLVPQPFSDGRRIDRTLGSVSTMIGPDLVARELIVREMNVPDWVTTYGGECDVNGRITIPAGGFATCEVTNTYLPDGGEADAVLTLVVSVDGGTLGVTTDDFAYVVMNDVGDVVAGPLSAETDDMGFGRDTGRPSTSGQAMVALDYTPPGLSPGDPAPIFHMLTDRQPGGWVTNFNGDCDRDGNVNPALRTPTCTVNHVFIDADVAEGEGVLRIDKSLVMPRSVRGSVDEFTFDVTDPFDGDAIVLAGLVPDPFFDGTRVDGTQGSVASVLSADEVGRELEVRERGVPDWVATYDRDCNAGGRVTVPANGFATCNVTNTYLSGSGDSDTVLTLVVSVQGGRDGETTADFAYRVEDKDTNDIVAGPVSAQNTETGTAAERAGMPTTQGTAVVALDYTPPGWSPGDVHPAFRLLLEQPDRWVASVGGDCAPDGSVDPALRTPVCTVDHLFVDADVAAGEGVLRIEKSLVKPNTVRGSVADFVFDVTRTVEGDVAAGLSPEPHTTGTRIDTAQGSVATVIDTPFVNQALTVSERGVPDWVTTFGGDCDATGQVIVPTDGIAHCVVTNTHTPGAEGSDAVLTLEVSIDGGINTATTDEFAYIVEDDLGNIVAGPLSAEGGGTSSAAVDRGGPSTTGTAIVPLDYTPGGYSPTFTVMVQDQPSGWATNFGGDCGPDGGVDPALREALCTVTHLFVDPAPNRPQQQSPVALDDLETVFEFPFTVEAEVLANDYDADGNLDPSSVAIIIEPDCAFPDLDGFIYCNTSVLAGGIIRVEPLALPLSGELTYRVCDTTNRCDTAVLRFSTGLPPVALFYRDADEDNYGDPNVSVSDTSQPEGYVTNDGDCDDDDSSVNPDADEVVDGIDNDCDGFIDES